jgi:hypothetical protein
MVSEIRNKGAERIYRHQKGSNDFNYDQIPKRLLYTIEKCTELRMSVPKTTKKRYFMYAYDTDYHFGWFLIKQDLDIKRSVIHRKISSGVKSIELTRGQTRNYMSQLKREKIIFKVMKSQLSFHII